MTSLLLLAALGMASEPGESGLSVDLSEGAPPLYRVEDPFFPGAAVRSPYGAILTEPPPPGVKWQPEPLGTLDGVFPDRVDYEAAEVMGVRPWHDAGFKGQGVKVAIFDSQWFLSGAEDQGVLGESVVSTHDCWKQASCLVPIDVTDTSIPAGRGSHGYSCAQIVHDVAPEASLYLVNINGLTTFENAARWAIAEGIDVISLSMSFFNASFYDGTGPFKRVMDELAAAGVVLATSSGNYANQHWSGPYVDADLDGRMDFDGRNYLEVSFNNAGSKSVTVNWNEWGACGRSDLDTRVTDSEGNIIGRSNSVQSATADRCSPLERTISTVDESGVYRLEVWGTRVITDSVQLTIFANNGQVVDAMPAFSMADPSPHYWSYVVGAVRAKGYLDNDVEVFSSQGPVLGGALKPDIAGPDGLTTSRAGLNGFYGTSAATPAVVGAMAVLMSRYPELTPEEAGQRLKALAVYDGQRMGDDPRWGAGKAHLPPVDVEPLTCSNASGTGASVGLLGLLALFRRRRS